jgi:CubicO group peptidase (beta-lactamase class C family)
MLTDQLTAGQRAGAAPFLSDDTSWGLGLAVPVAGASPGAMPHGYGWDGGTGTTWRTDPRTGLSGILFTQRSMTSPQPPQVFTDFWRCAQDCLDG